MKRYLIIASLILICGFTYGQKLDSAFSMDEIQLSLSKLTERIKSLEKVNSGMAKSISEQKKHIDLINSQLEISNSNINQIADSLHIKIANFSTSINVTQNQIQSINKSITARTLFWIIGIIAVISLIVFVFIILRNKLSITYHNLDSQIAKTHQIFQNEAIKLDSKLAEILQSQLILLKEERTTTGISESESDHKLPLKVGDEIHRMRKRIENMPQNVKGISALTNSLQRLEEEFNESGYEIEDLIGKKYIDGMKVEARFVDDPKIPKGEEIITDVLRPSIKFKGVVIQVAKIEVGKSY